MIPGLRFHRYPGRALDHSAVWTGSEMIIWGGVSNEPGDYLNTGARYTPGTDSWAFTSIVHAPPARAGQSAVWTGSQIIVWGGGGDGDGDGRAYGLLNSGGKYNPAADNWTATTTTNAPAARAQHSTIWTGSEMIVWGGTWMWWKLQLQQWRPIQPRHG